MSETYGALQAASNDAGSWTLIEQGDTGEWAPMARGGKNNIVKLAQLLNTAETLLEKQTDPAIRAANLEAIKENVELSGPDTITRNEVLSWTESEYMAARERLWLEYRGTGSGRAPHYFDGEHGREYDGPAGALMTGNAGEFVRAQLERPPLRVWTPAAEAARDVAQTWQEGRGRGIHKDVRIAWPGLAAQLDKLAEQWADRGPRP